MVEAQLVSIEVKWTPNYRVRPTRAKYCEEELWSVFLY